MKKQITIGFTGVLFLSFIPLITPTLRVSTKLKHVPSELRVSMQQPNQFFLLYAGYAGCDLECPKTLSTLADLSVISQSIPVFMMDLLSSEELNTNYAAQFHPQFKTLPKDEAFLAELGSWWQISTDQIKDITHSDRLYLIYYQNNSFKIINHYKGSSDSMAEHLLETLERLSDS